MKIAYFDCFSGISGNMVLGALIDLGLEINFLTNELNKLNLDKWDLCVKKFTKGHIAGTMAEVIYNENGSKPRHYKDIISLIDGSQINTSVRKKAKEIFYNLAKAEGKIHNTPLDDVHFHEIGAVDTIVDIVGSVIGIEKLGLELVYSSNINLGSGFVLCGHGKLPVPAPATAEILIGAPVYSNGKEDELVTPTGAAIIKSYGKGFGAMPLMKLEKIGYGVGTRNPSQPNILRVFMGEGMEEGYETTRLHEISTRF